VSERIPKSRFQFDFIDLLVLVFAIAFIVRQNQIPYASGSGIITEYRGAPFPVVSWTSLRAEPTSDFHALGLIVDLVVWLAIICTSVALMRKIRNASMKTAPSPKSEQGL